METILDIILVSACLTSVVTNLVYLFSVKKLNRAADKVLLEYPKILNSLEENQGAIEDAIEQLPADLDRSLAAFKEDFQAYLDRKWEMAKLDDAIKPRRENNWDSMREAFKGPTRVEINE